MPATEQTWRDVKRMHVWLAASAVLMLFASLLTFFYDWDREWKPIQRQYQKLDVWTQQARLVDDQSAGFEAERAKLVAALAKEMEEAPPKDKIALFREQAGDVDLSEVDAALDAFDNAPTAENREAVTQALQKIVSDAKFVEDDLQRKLKFRRADLDVARSEYDLGIDGGASEKRLGDLEGKVVLVQADVDQIQLDAQAATTHRKDLEATLNEINKGQDAAKKALGDHDANVQRLEKSIKLASHPMRALLEAPILDAFNSPLKIKQDWLPNLTLSNNFQQVARFDRCRTCHQGIDVTAAGSAVLPGYKEQESVAVSLKTPKEAPTMQQDAAGNEQPISTEQVYGFELAPEGLFAKDDVTIQVVRPRTLAADAQLRSGDVIEQINDVKLLNKDVALTYLLNSVTWGQPLSLQVRRGVPQPFASHPRLDLYMGSLSPHKVADVGCTICHDGQGSATAFKWASHSPNDPAQAEEWATKHGWFDNHHWVYPMRPNRFVESNCLKCHHDVTELAPSERFPDPPAPKLTEGYNLIRQYGCFGCHEINGFDGPTKRIGPDLRAEPNYAAAALQLLDDKGLDAQERSLAERVAEDPSQDQSRRLLMQLVEADAKRAAAPNADPPAHLTAVSHKMAAILADTDMPGQFRKVGPSLRYAGSKVDFTFLYNWVKEPKNFRPTTKMPQFFGLHDHLRPEPELDEHDKPVLDEHGHAVMVESPGLKESLRFEPVEIRSVAEYLVDFSQPFEYLDQRPANVTEEPSAERGKALFQLKGCLACHQHTDFPAGKATQGPDLSRMGAKLANPNGARWLYSWLQQPSHYHARTVMPKPVLDPAEQKDKDGEVTAVTDPAADITAFLLGSLGWKPQETPEFDEKEKQALDDLAFQYLTGFFPRAKAKEYLKTGIPDNAAKELRGDETLLVGLFPDADVRHKKLRHYVGKRTITKFGCSGCHDIPGFENAKPIGTALADWGRKDPSKLAFEHITEYVALGDAHGDHGHAAEGGHGHLSVRDMDPDEGFFMEKLLHHERSGFFWQKLREPRSYDYLKTENKAYNDRLRMPKFPFDQKQIEAIATFVLGLVAEPPAAQYVYQPAGRQKALVEGKQVLDRFNCAGCHQLQPDQFAFDFNPSSSSFAAERPFPANEYPLFKPEYSEKTLAESKSLDRRGLGHGEIVAGVITDEQGVPAEQEDDDNPELMVNFYQLWHDAPLNGQPWLTGDQLGIPKQWITQHRGPQGGDFARLVHPVALADERKVNPNAKYQDAWGWVPPPLYREGLKVQTAWLHDYLLAPYAIRPATVLRMPKFNMSSAEASKLANYFAARDNADYPYEFDARTTDSHLASAEAKFPGRLEDALRIVINGNYCIKCHKLGDFTPPGSDKALAPHLDQVYKRLRPEFLQKWLANPKRLLPYTGMPVNFPLDKPIDPKGFKEKGELIEKGTSEEQLQAVVDLLLNYDRFMEGKTSIKPLITTPPVPTPTPAAAGGQ